LTLEKGRLSRAAELLLSAGLGPFCRRAANQRHPRSKENC